MDSDQSRQLGHQNKPPCQEILQSANFERRVCDETSSEPQSSSFGNHGGMSLAKWHHGFLSCSPPHQKKDLMNNKSVSHMTGSYTTGVQDKVSTEDQLIDGEHDTTMQLPLYRRHSIPDFKHTASYSSSSPLSLSSQSSATSSSSSISSSFDTVPFVPVDVSRLNSLIQAAEFVESDTPYHFIKNKFQQAHQTSSIVQSQINSLVYELQIAQQRQSFTNSISSLLNENSSSRQLHSTFVQNFLGSTNNKEKIENLSKLTKELYLSLEMIRAGRSQILQHDKHMSNDKQDANYKTIDLSDSEYSFDLDTLSDSDYSETESLAHSEEAPVFFKNGVEISNPVKSTLTQNKTSVTKDECTRNINTSGKTNKSKLGSPTPGRSPKSKGSRSKIKKNNKQEERQKVGRIILRLSPTDQSSSQPNQDLTSSLIRGNNVNDSANMDNIDTDCCEDEIPEKCLQCDTEDTPEWRKGPYGQRTLCNACGLFFAKILRRVGYKIASDIVRRRRGLNKGHNRRNPSDAEIAEYQSGIHDKFISELPF